LNWAYDLEQQDGPSAITGAKNPAQAGTRAKQRAGANAPALSQAFRHSSFRQDVGRTFGVQSLRFLALFQSFFDRSALRMGAGPEVLLSLLSVFAE
jgi:hypothetical protein